MLGKTIRIVSLLALTAIVLTATLIPGLHSSPAVARTAWSQAPQAKPPVPPTGLKVFLAKGKNAVSDFNNKNVVDNLKAGVFKGQTVTAHIEGENKQDFLRTFAESDVVYVSCHSRVFDKVEALVVGSDESVLPSDISRAIRESGKPGPSFVMVAGCSTLENEASNIATGMGIKPGTKGKVYLGWKGKIFGSVIDRSMSVFWQAFMKPDETGRFRTVEEAKAWALKHGAVSGWGSFEIIGDGSLRATDIVKAPPAKPAQGAWVQTGFWRFHRATWVPDIQGKVEFIGYTAKVMSSLGTSLHEWTIPPKQLTPGDLLKLDLKVERAGGVFTRAYTLVFFGRPSKATRGMGFGVVMIPPSMDWAGTQGDSGPMFSHATMAQSVVRDGKEFIFDCTLEGGKFLTGAGKAEGPWSGRVPEAAAGGKFYLIISTGHAGRGVQVESLAMTIESTCSVAGAQYYEYTWRGN
ncbi:MAG: hypothetical protein NTZ26_09365 [Candidatus Aminicenantes bacterium]|nr:hypothetical protein [Candidatus Aminicenantes bacterium]